MVTKDLGMVTAYAYAVAGGYTGTEAEFTQLMADLAVVVDDFDNFSVNVTTLPAGSSATASYADGVLSLGIPKGDKGDKGNTGETGAPAGFGTVSATVDDSIGTPSVKVTASGADTAKNFAFAFHNLKGEQGDKGDTGEVSEAELEETLEAYAKTDGYYSNLTAGSAEQLLSTVTIEDEVPYLFRTSGGSVEIGDRETDCVVGGTVAWNQLAYANYDYTLDRDNNRTVSVFTHDVPSIIGHKYLVSATITADTTADGVAFQYGFTQTLGKGVGFKAVIYQATSVASYCYTYIGSTEASGTSLSFKGFNIFDLTQMFGSTIADYIYSLEQATEGAGVAWFRKLFPKPYYAYNAGEPLSVSGVSAHNMTGFNQWDEEWEVGGYNESNGNKDSATDIIRCKNFIPVVPNTAYYCSYGSANMVYECFFYDADKNYISYTSTNNGIVVTPSNCHNMTFRCRSAYGTTYKNDICINLHWDGSRNGEYEPYELHSYPLDSDLTLRGIPKLSAGNDLYYDGDVYEPDGTVTRRYGVVDLGTLNWSPLDGRFVTDDLTTSKVWGGTDIANAVCTQYTLTSVSNVYSGASDKIFGIGRSASGGSAVARLWFNDTAYTSATAFKEAMSGVYLVYELATPTTETADPYTNPQIVDDFGTEEYVSTSIVPVGHKTQYMPNLRAKLEMAPDSPSGDGDYIVRQTNGTNEYVLMANNATIQNIISRLEALEGQNG